MTRRQIQAREIAAQAAVDQFNKLYPVGTRCRYWPGIKEGTGVRGAIREPAEVFCGTAVVCVVAPSLAFDRVALDHVEPVQLCERCKAELEPASAIIQRMTGTERSHA